jgi:acetyltransferase-like isoleucine patch superfamily enzyme
VTIFDPVTIGFPIKKYYGISNEEFFGAMIHDDVTLRSGTIIYCYAVLGQSVSTGHNVIIREHTHIGNNTSVGTNTIIEGHCKIGKFCNIQSNVFIPTECNIGNDVFIGPCCVFTNDKYPPSYGELEGVTIGDGARIGANVTVVPGIHIGRDAFVAAGSLVTKDVPMLKMAIGSPARIQDLPRGMSK